MDTEQILGERFFHLDTLDAPDSWPAVGSDEWLKRFLLRLLDSIHHAAKQTFGSSPYDTYDQDVYVYLIIPPRHRRLRRLLAELEEAYPAEASCLDPKNEAAARLVQSALKAIGVDAEIRVRYRDENIEVAFR